MSRTTILTLRVILVAARLGLRTYMRQWSYWISDSFLVLALISYAAIVAGDLYHYSLDHTLDLYANYGDAYAKVSSLDRILDPGCLTLI